MATISGEPIVLGGDPVLEVEGIPMDSTENITRILRFLGAMAPGSQYEVTALRAGRLLTLTGRIP